MFSNPFQDEVICGSKTLEKDFPPVQEVGVDVADALDVLDVLENVGKEKDKQEVKKY